MTTTGAPTTTSTPTTTTAAPTTTTTAPTTTPVPTTTGKCIQCTVCAIPAHAPVVRQEPSELLFRDSLGLQHPHAQLMLAAPVTTTGAPTTTSTPTTTTAAPTTTTTAPTTTPVPTTTGKCIQCTVCAIPAHAPVVRQEPSELLFRDSLGLQHPHAQLMLAAPVTTTGAPTTTSTPTTTTAAPTTTTTAPTTTPVPTTTGKCIQSTVCAIPAHAPVVRQENHLSCFSGINLAFSTLMHS